MELKRGGEISITIDDFAFGGKGITKIQTEEGNYVIFTQNGIPGQKVIAKIIKKKKSFAECRILQVIEKSPLEKPTEFQSISGAPYISLPIEKQHEFKLDSTFELFKKIGGICTSLTGVIAPSTAVAHLAAAVGKSTIIIENTRTWCPTINGLDAFLPCIKRISPPNTGDWEWVFNGARQELDNWLSSE